MSGLSFRITLLADRVHCFLKNEDGCIESSLRLLQDLKNGIEATRSAVRAVELKMIRNLEILPDWNERSQLDKFLTSVRKHARDAEVVLDKLEYRILERTNKRNHVRLPKDLNLKVFLGCVRRPPFSSQNDDILMSAKRFHDMAKSRGHVEPIDLGGTSLQEGRRLAPIPPVNTGPPELVGRDEEKETILQFLMATGIDAETSSHDKVRVLPIFGVGGVGKTSLAQWAYNLKIVEQQFGLRVWVHASKRLEVEEIMTRIVESAAIERPHDLYTASIQELLSRGLEGKRFLLILDDVEVTDIWKWKILIETLNHGKEGSRLLMTTRDEMLPEILNTNSSLHLYGLKNADTWSFFMKCAFGHENPEHHPELEEIATSLSRILTGIPLEVKIIGGLLNSCFSESLWRAVLEKYLLVGKRPRYGALPSLDICYSYLPEHLKQCFTYCSVFPKDYAFEKDRFVRIWLALGFILPSVEKKMEDIGREYFDELVQRSFFEKKQHQDGYVIHDLLHDLALQITFLENVFIDDNLSYVIPQSVRHLHIRSNRPETLSRGQRQQMQSLIVHGKFNVDYVLNDLEEFKRLRVLILSEVHIEFLPKSIGELRQLRYLELDNIDIVKLPDSVLKLYHLQGLSLKNCVKLLNLPEGLHNLVNLRYLKQ